MTQFYNQPGHGASDALLHLEAAHAEIGRLTQLLSIAVKKAGGRVVIDDEDLREPIGLDVEEQPDETVLTTILAH